MSGGSMNYLFVQIEEYADMLEDKELIELAKDMSKLFHDAEWYHSSDTCLGTYRESIKAFKDKWFKNSRQERMKGYIDQALEKTRADLYATIGVPLMCQDCKHSTPCEHKAYVKCDKHPGCLWHNMDSCEDFEK